MADGTPLKKIGALLVAGTTLGALALGPVPAHADDIESFGGDIVVTMPQEQEEQARGISRMSLPVAQTSQVGTWVEVKRSESTYILQTCSYYISPNANPNGSVNVTVKTTMYNKASNSGIFWTTTKTLYDNGNRCAFIGEDWNSRAYLHESISEEATFSVRGGGIHRITSTETTFRGSAETTSGWDFTINIPFTICASAGEGGSISPSGATLVSTGESRSYGIAADSGWRIKDVTVDGNSVGPQGSYTFSNVSSDHTISASFQKVWNVKFVDGITGEVIGEQLVDAGSAATPPEEPRHDGYRFAGWDGDYSQVGSDLTITSRHEPVISVRVPALLPCKIMADGSVIVPSGYAIENLSVVPVRAARIETKGMPEDATYTLRDGDTPVHTWKDTDVPGDTLAIDSKASKELGLEISNVSGNGAWRRLAEKSATNSSIEELCTISYTFEAAS